MTAYDVIIYFFAGLNRSYSAENSSEPEEKEDENQTSYRTKSLFANSNDGYHRLTYDKTIY